MKNLKQRLMQISEELRQLAEGIEVRNRHRKSLLKRSEVFLPTSAEPALPQT